VRAGRQELPARVLMGPLLGELLGAHAAGHPLLDAGALQQAPPQLVVVIVGDKARRASLAVPRLLDKAPPLEAHLRVCPLAVCAVCRASARVGACTPAACQAGLVFRGGSVCALSPAQRRARS